MPNLKISSFFSKIVFVFLLFFCCDNIFSKNSHNDADLPAIKFWQKKEQVEKDTTSFVQNKHLSRKNEGDNHWTFHKEDESNAPLLDLKYDSTSCCWKIAFLKKINGNLCLSRTYAISKERVKANGITIFVTDTDEQKIGYKKGATHLAIRTHTV